MEKLSLKFYRYYDTIIRDVVEKRRSLPSHYSLTELRKICESAGCEIFEGQRGSHYLTVYHPALEKRQTREYLHGTFQLPRIHGKGSKNKPLVTKRTLERACLALLIIKEEVENDDTNEA